MTAPARPGARPDPRLFYLAPSHYCEKARKILEFKKIPFELANVPYGNHRQVIRETGQDYVPAIVRSDGKPVLWPDIADWAEATKPEPTLYPGNAKEMRARTRIAEHWAHQVVEEAVWKYVASDVPKVLEDEQERWIFVEMQERKRGPLELMAQRKGEFLSGVKEVCGLMQDLLSSHGQDYVLGPKPSLADFAFYGALHPLKYTGNEIPKDFPTLRQWHERVHEL